MPAEKESKLTVKPADLILANGVVVTMTVAFLLYGFFGGLIFLQPDISAAATVLIIGVLLFFLAGGDLRQIVLFCLVLVIVALLA
mgnify:CR=1 FL=1